MSALFNFESFLTVVLLVICTCTYIKIHFPTVLDRKTGFRGFFWKAARIGMRDPLTEEPPPSRFDPEELNLFEPFETVDLTPPSITWAPSVDEKLQSGKLRPQLLIVALSKVGISLVHNLAGKTVIGNIVLAGSSTPKALFEASVKDKTCFLFGFDPPLSVIVVSVQYLVPAEIANLWTKLLFQNVEADRVLVLEHTPIRHFRGKLSIDEPALFVLKTDKQKAQDKDATVIPYYPSGSLVDGLAAALLTHCQIRKIKGQLILTWPEEDSALVKKLVTALSDVLQFLPEGVDINFQEAAKNLTFRRPPIRNDLYI